MTKTKITENKKKHKTTPGARRKKVTITDRQLVAAHMHARGMKANDLAQAWSISPRMAAYDLKKGLAAIQNTPAWRALYESVHSHYLKKIDTVFRRYLDGDGKAVGGDLELAIRLAEEVGILQKKSSGRNPGDGDAPPINLQFVRIENLKSALPKLGVPVPVEVEAEIVDDDSIK